MELKIKRLHPAAIIPRYATDGAACFDLHAIEDATVSPGTGITIGTGLAFEVPPGWVLKVYSRSGHGFKHGVRLVNGTGIIDSDYRGQVHVGLFNDGFTLFQVKAGDRIGQAMLQPAPRVTLTVVDDLSETIRGAGGLGSTGSN